MVADVAEVRLLESVLQEGVSRGVGWTRRTRRRADGQGKSRRHYGGRSQGRDVTGLERSRHGHADGAQLTRAAAVADLGTRTLEEVVGTFAAEAFGPEGKRALQLLKLKEKRERKMSDTQAECENVPVPELMTSSGASMCFHQLACGLMS